MKWKKNYLQNNKKMNSICICLYVVASITYS